MRMNAKHSLNHGQCNAGDGLESGPGVIQKSSKTESPDFSFRDEGSIVLLTPLSPSAHEYQLESCVVRCNSDLHRSLMPVRLSLKKLLNASEEHEQ
jgi:hypothetical protein